MRKTKKGFTLIELMIIVSIIALLAVAITSVMLGAKKEARINNTKNTLKSTLLAVISCKDSGGNVNTPIGSESGAKSICNPAASFSNAFWPMLNAGYTYSPTGIYNSVYCSFDVDTNGDSETPLHCDCNSQTCN